MYKTHTFINTCVLDALLAGIHITAGVHLHIRELFMKDKTINAVMALMDSGNYTEAKALWLINLDLHEGNKKYFSGGSIIDIRGHVKDHLTNFSDLTKMEYYFDDERGSPNLEDSVYSKTVRQFWELGDVRALGFMRNPQFILVDFDGRFNEVPPLVITDVYEREYKLHFLLLGIIRPSDNHMVLCITLNGKWWLYDSMNPQLFSFFPLEDIKTEGYAVYLAAYVSAPTKEKQD
ncbi:hypothetical protein GJAV_G00129570 [Gymnothorax javanicus]|nr:hypothetical protein GJAV_G00129570 [Gymnothorax javanicus]